MANETKILRIGNTSCTITEAPTELYYGNMPQIVDHRNIMGWGVFSGKNRPIYSYGTYEFVIPEKFESIETFKRFLCKGEPFGK